MKRLLILGPPVPGERASMRIAEWRTPRQRDDCTISPVAGATYQT